jgi:hypothetical protein
MWWVEGWLVWWWLSFLAGIAFLCLLFLAFNLLLLVLYNYPNVPAAFGLGRRLFRVRITCCPRLPSCPIIL